MGRSMCVLMKCGVYFASLHVILASDDTGLEPFCGREASPHPLHRDPWLVYLEFHRRGYLTEIRCAGSLLSSRHVLTAAHCLTSLKYLLVARLGEFDLRSEVDCLNAACADPVKRIPVQSVTAHPGFDGKQNDIAVLTLAEVVVFTDFIRAICLPTDDVYPTMFHAAGWGEIVSTGQFSDIKKSIPLPYWSFDRCQQAYTHDALPQHAICAGGEKDIDTCRGDSGGPLMRGKDKNKVEIWGVTSSGPTKCGKEGKPGIYTSVLYYKPWVLENMNLT